MLHPPFLGRHLFLTDGGAAGPVRALTLVQFATATSAGDGSATTVTLGANPTLGNILLLGVANYGETNPANTRFLSGLAMTLIQGDGPARPGSYGTAWLYYRIVQAGDGKSVADNGSAGRKNNGLILAEFSGLVTSGPSGSPVSANSQHNATLALALAAGAAALFANFAVFATGQLDGGSAIAVNGSSTQVGSGFQYIQGAGGTGTGGIIMVYGTGSITLGGTLSGGFDTDFYWTGASTAWARIGF